MNGKPRRRTATTVADRRGACLGPRAQVDPRLLGEALLFDEPVIIENNPQWAIGLSRATPPDTVRPQSLFSLDPLPHRSRTASRRRGSTCAQCQDTRLDDGTVVRFDGAVPCSINVQVSHEPLRCGCWWAR